MKDKFTPDMDKLRAELGREPPPPPETKPEDYAPKRRPQTGMFNAAEGIGETGIHAGVGQIEHELRSRAEIDPLSVTWPEVEVAQGIKSIIRTTEGWGRLTLGEREALDMIATDISRILVGRDYWGSIGKWTMLGSLSGEGDLRGGPSQ